MLDRLFGPHRSVQRQISIWLTFVVVALGFVAMVVQSIWMGALVVLVGVLSGALLARMAENRVARAASTELLGSVGGDLDEPGLQRMVDRARTGSPAKMPDLGEGARAAGEDDALPWSEDRPRR